MDDWSVSDWREWDDEQNAKLDPEWVRKYGRQSFEAAVTLFGCGSILKGTAEWLAAPLPPPIRPT